MTRLLALFTVSLLACGGSPPPTDSSSTGGQSSTSGQGSSGGEGATGDTEATGPAGDTESDKPRRKTNDAGTFQVNDSDPSGRPKQAKLKPTGTEAAVRFFVIDKNKGPVKGIVLALTSPTGEKYYTGETTAEGFVEILLPVGKTYKVRYLALGRKDVVAKFTVANKPQLNLKLTMRYEREEFPVGLVIGNINFPTGKATLTQLSQQKLDPIVEFMKFKKSAKVEISGHTDNVGNRRANKKLSQLRADAVRDYLISQGIDGSRIKAVGYGDEKPIASNKTPEGRERNRRIEATEL